MKEPIVNFIDTEFGTIIEEMMSSEDVVNDIFEKVLRETENEMGGKPTNRKQRRKFMKKATKEYNKQSFMKCSQKDLFK